MHLLRPRVIRLTLGGRLICVAEGRTVSEVAREALQKYLAS